MVRGRRLTGMQPAAHAHYALAPFTVQPELGAVDRAERFAVEALDHGDVLPRALADVADDQHVARLRFDAGRQRARAVVEGHALAPRSGARPRVLRRRVDRLVTTPTAAAGSSSPRTAGGPRAAARPRPSRWRQHATPLERAVPGSGPPNSSRGRPATMSLISSRQCSATGRRPDAGGSLMSIANSLRASSIATRPADPTRAPESAAARAPSPRRQCAPPARSRRPASGHRQGVALSWSPSPALALAPPWTNRRTPATAARFSARPTVE